LGAPHKAICWWRLAWGSASPNVSRLGWVFHDPVLMFSQSVFGASFMSLNDY